MLSPIRSLIPCKRGHSLVNSCGYVGAKLLGDSVYNFRHEVRMNHSEDTEQGVGDGIVRKPYEKPEVRYERVFETMAMSCGKVQATQGSCRFNRKSS